MSTSTRKEPRNVKRRSPVVDLRNRPRFLHPFFGAENSGPNFELVKWVNRRVGSLDIEHFTRANDSDAFVAEIEAAKIVRAVVVGRDTPTNGIPNDTVAQLVGAHRERLLGIGAVDPQRLGIAAAVDEVHRAIGSLKLAGINLDPGFLPRPLHADAAIFFPIYQACLELGVPVFIMSGPTTPDLEYNHPRAVGSVAGTFPKLKIVCCHGFYPFVDEMIGIAFKHENVYVSPDMYMFMPGAALYAEAANAFMADQLLFGSSYPFRPMRQSVEDAGRLGLKEDVYEQVMWRNADRLLGLGLEAQASNGVLIGSKADG
jgi:predicted TIM-barrel fold metal-dependent hydrolase